MSMRWRWAARAGTGDDSRGFAQFLGPLDACLGCGFARRDHAELHETIEKAEFLFVEVLRRRIVSNLGAIRETKQRGVDRFERTYTGSACGERLPEFATIVADGGDDAQARDSYPTLHRSGGCRSFSAACLASEQLRNAVDHIANRTQILRGLVRNIDIEFAPPRKGC